MVSSAAAQQGYGIGISLESGPLLFMFSVVAVLAVIVDVVLNSAEENTKGTAYQAMVQRIYREIMVMGFTSFLIGTVQATGVSLGWEDYYFFCDQLTFLSAFFFAFHGLIIMFISVKDSSSWERAEKIKLSELLGDVEKTQQINSFWNYRFLPLSPTRDQVEFRMFRSLFASTYHIGGVLSGFDFSQYMRLIHENNLLVIIDLNALKWCFMVFLIALVSIKKSFFPTSCDTNEDENECNYRLDIGIFAIGGYTLLLISIALIYIGRSSEFKLLCKIGVFDVTDYEIFLMKENSVMEIIGLRILDKSVIIDTIATVRYEKAVKSFSRHEGSHGDSMFDASNRKGSGALGVLRRRFSSFSRKADSGSNQSIAYSHADTDVFSTKAHSSNQLVAYSHADTEEIASTLPADRFGESDTGSADVAEGDNDGRDVKILDENNENESFEEPSVQDVCDKDATLEAKSKEKYVDSDPPQIGLKEGNFITKNIIPVKIYNIEDVYEFDEGYMEEESPGREGPCPVASSANTRENIRIKSWKKSLSKRGVKSNDTCGGDSEDVTAPPPTPLFSKSISLNRLSIKPDLIGTSAFSDSKKGRLMAPPKVRQKQAEHMKTAMFETIEMLPKTPTSYLAPSFSSHSVDEKNAQPSGTEGIKKKYMIQTSSVISNEKNLDSSQSHQRGTSSVRLEAAEKLKSILSNGFSMDGKEKHKIHFCDVFFMNRPYLFYWAIDLIIVCNSFYLSWWITTICIAAATLENVPEVILYEIISLLPTLLIIYCLTLLIKTSTILKALTELDLDIVTLVFKKTEATANYSNLLRKDILLRLNRIESKNMKHNIDHFFSLVRDPDCNELTMESFRRMLVKVHFFLEKPLWKSMFSSIDSNNNGTISLEV